MQRFLVQYSLLALFFVFISSCQDGEKEASVLESTYFYPRTDSPVVYIYQDSLNPIYELFERIIPYYDPLGQHLLIERYNANFQLIEAYDLLADQGHKVFNHILYANENQIMATITDSTFMPWSGKGKFSSSFPSTVDSIMFSMVNNRSLSSETGNFDWEGKTLKTRIFVDSISTLIIDLKNKREKPMNAVARHEFAEGIGRVRIQLIDGTSNLVLVGILSEKDWNVLRTR